MTLCFHPKARISVFASWRLFYRMSKKTDGETWKCLGRIELSIPCLQNMFGKAISLILRHGWQR